LPGLGVQRTPWRIGATTIPGMEFANENNRRQRGFRF
jgi:hypothetical protein